MLIYKKYDRAKLNNILSKQTSKILNELRCINMTMRQYEDKEHINKNMCCVEFTENAENVENGIVQKLQEIRSKIQVPYNNAIPLPIYVSIAKLLEKDEKFLLYAKFIKDDNDYSKTFQERYTFQGKINIIIYVPNLMNNVTDYTYYPSLEAYTNQNKWMELMTHPRSYFLRIVGNVKKKNNVYKTLTDNICEDYGCVSDAKEDISTMASTFFLPTKCLQHESYDKNMKVKVYNIFHVKPWDGGDHEMQNRYNDTLKRTLNERKGGDEDSSAYEDEEIDPEELKQIKTYALASSLKEEYIKYIDNGYNRQITEDFQIRNATSFPGIQEINYKMFKLNPSSDVFANKVNFHYMPWGDKLLNNQYVLNEGKTFDFEDIKYVSKDKTENKIIKFKSLNNRHYMKFSNEGKLEIYDENSDAKISDIPYLSNIEIINENKKSVNFDTSGVLHFNSSGDAQSKTIKIKDLSLNPYSIILDENNPGNLLIYGMGFEEIKYG
jgi:hypothetical protein